MCALACPSCHSNLACTILMHEFLFATKSPYIALKTCLRRSACNHNAAVPWRLPTIDICSTLLHSFAIIGPCPQACGFKHAHLCTRHQRALMPPRCSRIKRFTSKKPRDASVNFVIEPNSLRANAWTELAPIQFQSRTSRMPRIGMRRVGAHACLQVGSDRRVQWPRGGVLHCNRNQELCVFLAHA